MATLTERLALVIQGDASGAVQAFGLAGDAAKRANANATAGQNAFKASLDQWKQSPTVWAGVAAAAGAAILSATRKASDLNEQVSAATITFGSAAAGVQEFARTAVDSFGLSQTAALQAANSFAGLFKTAGLGPDATAQFSVALTKLGADIASFKNLSQSDVLGALRSGLTGEVEPLRRLDIILNDTTVTTKALALGLGDANGKVDDGAKVVARYALIMEQAKDKVGNFALTSDQLANSQRTLSAQLENFQSKAGQLTAGPLADLTTQLNNVLGAINKLPGGTTNLTTTLARVGAALGSVGLSEVIRGITSRLGDNKSATEQAADAQKRHADALAASNNITRAFAESTAQASKDEKDLTNSVVGLVRAREAQRRATDGIAKAQNAVREAQAEVNKLEREGAVNADRVASAQRTVRDATRGVVAALAAQADAQLHLDAVLKGAKAIDIREAELNLTDARREQERATLGVRKAQDELNRLVVIGVLRQGQQVSTVDGIAEANLNLADAKQQIERADINAQRAQERLNELQNQGKAGSQDLKDAQKALADATQAVADAQERATESQGELQKALEGDPEFQEKLRDARERVADAQERVNDAQRAARDAVLAAVEAQDAYNEALGTTADVTDRVLANLRGIQDANKGLDFSPFTSLVPANKPAFNPLATLQGVAGATANPFGAGPVIQATVNLSFGTTPQPWQAALAAQQVADELNKVGRRNG